MSETEIKVEAQLDFGPNTQVRLTEWIENVPVKDIDGRVIGRAKISDTGKIEAVIDEKDMSKELFNLLRIGVSDAISIETVVEPAESKQPTVKYSDEIRTRLDANNPLKKNREQEDDSVR